MKIAMLVPVFPKLSETFIAAKFLGLLERGHEVHVICRKFDRAALVFFPALAERDDLDRRVTTQRPTEPRWRAVSALPGAVASAFSADWRTTWRYLLRGGRRFGLDLPRQFYLDAGLIEFRPDIVHFEFGSLARQRLEQVEWIGAKSVVSFRGHDLLFVGLEEGEFYADVWRHADELHFLGTALSIEATRRGCPAGKPRRIIAPAIDTGFFNPGCREPYGILGTRQRTIRLASTGRLDWTKGYEYLLQAVARLKKSDVNVEYRVIGAGDESDALSFATREMRLDGSVTFLGAVPPAAVRSHLQWADIFLHGAVAEGFSNAVLEAQAMALPVVTSDACGLPENVIDGLTGFVVPRRNPAAMADRILRLAVNPDLRRKTGSAGRRRVSAEFNLERQIDAWEELYQSVRAVPPISRAREYKRELAMKERTAA